MDVFLTILGALTKWIRDSDQKKNSICVILEGGDFVVGTNLEPLLCQGPNTEHCSEHGCSSTLLALSVFSWKLAHTVLLRI